MSTTPQTHFASGVALNGTALSAVMISCAQRDEVRQDTLSELSRTDWGPAPVHVEMDRTAFARLQERQEHTSLAALRSANELGSPYCLFFEDDLLFNRRLVTNLGCWAPIRSGNLALASLYNPNIKRLRVRQLEHWFIADPNAIYGSQAFLLSLELIQFCIAHWWEVQGMQDIKISRLAARFGRPIYYHIPSLVQHRPVPSVWGGCRHHAGDFSADWLNPAAAEAGTSSLIQLSSGERAQ